MARRRVFKEGEKTLLSVYVSGKTYDELFLLAKDRNVSMSEMARQILEEKIKSERRLVHAV